MFYNDIFEDSPAGGHKTVCDLNALNLLCDSCLHFCITKVSVFITSLNEVSVKINLSLCGMWRTLGVKLSAYELEWKICLKILKMEPNEALDLWKLN
jgi:hypothetical protein